MKEQKPEVPETAGQVSEVRSRWEWAESSVWTDRMLEALEKGFDGVKENYFANVGLFSMYSAWREASSPQRG